MSLRTHWPDGGRSERHCRFAIAIGLAGCARDHGQTPEPAVSASSLLPGAEEGFVDSDGVKIHYVSLGKKEDPLIVMVHGFPDFWYSWRARCPRSRNIFMSWRSTSGV